MRSGIHSKRILSCIMALLLLFTALSGSVAWALEMPIAETEQPPLETVPDASAESISESPSVVADETSALPTMEIAPAPEVEGDPSPVPEQSASAPEESDESAQTPEPTATPTPEPQETPTPEPEETELPPQSTPEAEQTETPAPSEAPELRLSNEILFFELTLLPQSLEINVGETFNADTLPSLLSAAIVPEDEICAFVQLQPEEIGAYTAPEDAQAQYESGVRVVYHLEGEAENAYRLYGIADGKEGWFACTEDGDQILAMIQPVSVQWDASNVDCAQPGTYALCANAQGFTLSCPQPEVRLNVAAQADAEEIEDNPFADAVLGDETAPIDEGASGNGETNLGTHTIRWIGGSTKTEISGSDLIMTPNNNYEHYIDCQIDFSMGGEQSAEAGAIEIRIPRHVFYTRENEPYGNIVVPLAQAPEEAGETSFHYRIDEETDEIVITNYRRINPSDVFTCQIRYNFYPQYIADGFTNDSLQATFKVTPEGEGQQSITAESEKLSLKLNTSLDRGSASKSKSQKYETWQSEWGEAPEGSENYFYVQWKITVRVYDGTQPYRMSLREEPGNSGEFIGYSRLSSNTDFQRCTQEEYESIVYGDIIRKNTNVYFYYEHFVVLRYPRSMLEENPSPTITNKIVGILEGFDGDHQEFTGNASYTYVAPNVNYPGNSCSIYKYMSGYSEVQGGINSLRAGRTLQKTYYMNTSMRAYDLTEDGTKPYTTVLEDRLLYLGSERLLPGDYEFTSFRLSTFWECDYTIDPDTGWKIKEKSWMSCAPIEVQYKTDPSSDWQKWGTIEKNSSQSYRWSDMNGNVKNYCSASTSIALPEKTCEVRFVHKGTQVQVGIYIYLDCSLYPTEHVLQQLPSDGSTIQWSNINGAYAQAEDNTIYGSGGYINSTYSQAVNNWDNQEYGQQIMHYQRDIALTALKPNPFVSKTKQSQTTDVLNSREVIQYELHFGDKMFFDISTMTAEEVIALNVFPEEREGVFYELLPLGMTLDVNAVKAYTYSSSSSIVSSVCDHTLELIENWRGSGRTMVKISVSVPENVRNFGTTSDYIVTGLAVDITAYYPWKSVKDYGTSFTNSMAYYSLSDQTNGTADTGGRIGDKALFYDLDGDGNPADAPKNVWYAQCISTVNPVTAAEMGLKKTVKTSEDAEYAMSTTAGAAGSYSYMLRFENGTSGKAKNVILFDVLEAAHGGKNHWKGTLKSVDTSQAQEKGIDAVVYYSTYANFSDLAQSTDLTDLSNAQIWTRTASADLKDVTAIAIDLRYKKDGTEYEFPLSEVVRCTIHMTAPENYQDYVDDPTTEADETAYAYNSAYLHSQLVLSSGDVSNTAVEECARTTVALRAPKVEIHKTSDPSSGTQQEPALVSVGNTITYDIAVSNAEKAETIYDLEIADALPEGLDLQTGEIQYYFGSAKANAKPISESSRISMRTESGKLIFTVDKLSANETLHLLIPAKVSDSASGTVFANTAVLEKFNDKQWDMRSETTYHEAFFGYELPITGGKGASAFYAMGAGMLLLACLYFRAHRRKGAYERKGREAC